MVAIFSKSTCVLSNTFVECFTPNILADIFETLGRETGVGFKLNRDSKSYSISGEWNVILEAHRLLSDYYDVYFENEYTENDALTVKERQNYSNRPESLKLISLEGDKALHDILPKPIVIQDGYIKAKGGTTSFKNNKCQDESDTDEIEECVSGFDDNNLETSGAASPDDLIDETEKHLDDSSTDIEENYVQIYDRQSNTNPVSDDLSNHERDEWQFRENQDAFQEVKIENNSKRIFTVSPERTKTWPRKTTSKAKSNIVKEEDEDIDIHSENSYAETESEDESETIKCNLCNYVGKKKKDLKAHKIRKHTPKNSCQVCQRKFGFKKDLNRHMKNVHAETKVGKVSKKEKAVRKKDKEVNCGLCSYRGKWSNMKQHNQRNHHLPNKPEFKCSVCHKIFYVRKDLKRHERLVHTDTSYYCNLCKKSYKWKRAYNNHLATHKEGYVKPYFACKLCPKSFSTKHVLKNHVDAEHFGMKKSYVCPTCNRTFTQRSSYFNHAKVHAGIKPYVCDVCGKSFTYDKSLKQHKYLHEDIKRFQCDICPKAFRQTTSLRLHMKTHNNTRDYICAVCAKSFTQKHSLLRHERIHSGEKPFVCRICKKTFNDYSIIRRHIMLIHKKDSTDWQGDMISNLIERKDFYIQGRPGQIGRNSTTAKVAEPKVICEIECDKVLSEISDVLKKNSSSEDVRKRTDTIGENMNLVTGLPSEEIIGPKPKNVTDVEHVLDMEGVRPPQYPIHVPNQVTSVNVETYGLQSQPSLTACVPLNYSVTSSHTTDNANMVTNESSLVSSENSDHPSGQNAYHDLHRQWSHLRRMYVSGGQTHAQEGYVGELNQPRILPVWANQSHGPDYCGSNALHNPQNTDSSEN